MITYTSVNEYNEAHPERSYPKDDQLEGVALLANSVDSEYGDCEVEFFPGGSQGDPDEIGNVVARQAIGLPPVLLLAENVTRGKALKAVFERNATASVEHLERALKAI